MKQSISSNHYQSFLFFVALFLFAPRLSSAQQASRSFSVDNNTVIEVHNLSGRVRILSNDEDQQNITATATSAEGASRTSIAQVDFAQLVHVINAKSALQFEVQNRTQNGARIDLELKVPPRAKVSIVTSDGAVDLMGNFRAAKVETGSGTIHVDVPLDGVRYDFNWVASRPRFLSEVELSKMVEKAAGRYQIKGRLGDSEANKEQGIDLSVMTRRGALLFGVNPDSAPADLRPRALTVAAQTIIDGGNKEMS
ncbi:MAG: hypothetical protein ACRD4L_11705, partial [Pyrinomonadaceae bacterium]